MRGGRQSLLRQIQFCDKLIWPVLNSSLRRMCVPCMRFAKWWSTINYQTRTATPSAGSGAAIRPLRSSALWHPNTSSIRTMRLHQPYRRAGGRPGDGAAAFFPPCVQPVREERKKRRLSPPLALTKNLQGQYAACVPVCMPAQGLTGVYRNEAVSWPLRAVGTAPSVVD